MRCALSFDFLFLGDSFLLLHRRSQGTVPSGDFCYFTGVSVSFLMFALAFESGLSQVSCGAGGGGEELCEGSGHFA